MARVTPDPTFYPSPKSAMQAPPEELAYVVLLNVGHSGTRRPDALAVLDANAASSYRLFELCAFERQATGGSERAEQRRTDYATFFLGQAREIAMNETLRRS